VNDRADRVLAGIALQPTLDRYPESIPIAERMAALGVPAVSVAVIDNGEIAWARAVGTREGDLPATPETLFQAGSISKPVAAIGIMHLVEQGLLDLDEDVNAYLRSWKLRPNGEWQPRVTLRMLLSHSAGTTVHGFPGYNREAPVPSVPQILDGLPPANTRPVRVNILPGTQFRYSGGGTTIAQLVVEDVTGQRFPEYMRESVLDPIGMMNSTYEQPLPEHLWPRSAAGHRAGGQMVSGKWHVYPENGSCGVVTWRTRSL
jgi:CubicO group peptidase (beta-lactamase class C family)